MRSSVIVVCLLLTVTNTMIFFTDVSSGESQFGEVWVDGNASAGWYDASHVRTIQEGINNVSVGGVVYVRSGTYFEHVDVNKQVTLQGENKYTTIIDGGNSPGTTIKLQASHVTIKDFMIRNSRLPIPENPMSPIPDPPYSAIFIDGEGHNTISDTIITDNDYGIYIVGAEHNTFINNTIKNTMNIGLKTLVNQWPGPQASWNMIYHNNFINNGVHAEDPHTNTWDNGWPSGGNYWDDYIGNDIYFGPNQDKPGKDRIGDTEYVVPQGSNMDRYPLMDPWPPINNPPDKPASPSGSINADTGKAYTYTVNSVIDPDNDIVACLFDWGDGSYSGWTTFQSSGSSFSASHAWQSPGSYNVRAKAKDHLGAESPWSSALTVTVSIDTFPPPPPPPPPPPTLALSYPTSVIEDTSFEVTVTANGDPIENCLVRLSNMTSVTNRNGVAQLQAPRVNYDTNYIITATCEGYQSTTGTITIRNQRVQTITKSSIYGQVTDESGKIIKNAFVSVKISAVATLKTFTDEQGYLLSIPAGNYSIDVWKRGYALTRIDSIDITENTSLKMNFVLNQTTEHVSEPPRDHQTDIVEAMIETAVFAKKVTAELNIAPTINQYDIILYEGDLYIKNISIHDTKISFIVNATDLPGSIIALRLFDQQNLSNIKVEYDNQTLEQISFTGLFTLVENTTPTYAWIKTTQDNQTMVYCLVYLPYFSEHKITIYTIEEIAEVVSKIAIVFSYIIVCAIASIVFFSPVVIRFLRRVYFHRKE